MTAAIPTASPERLGACAQCQATDAILGDCGLCVGCCLLHCTHQHDCHMACLACADQAQRGADYCGGDVCRGGESTR